METIETLFIIGNGFDLCLGLKTTYNDFFKSSLVQEEYSKYGKGERINLFLAYLFEAKPIDPYWYQIEEKIEQYVKNLNDTSYLASLRNDSKSKIGKLLAYILQEEYKVQIDKINIILFAELKKFEKIFGNYIINEEKKILEFNSNYNYVVHAEKETIEKIQEIILYGIDFSSNNTLSLINFNYTNFIDFCLMKSTNFKLNDMNIHGDVEEPIFGIDSNYNNDPNLVNFTKTSRVLGSWTIHDQWKLPEPKYLYNINFFGHSLSKADYSYFQSIFDYYNIYDSNIQLNFFYNENYDTTGTSQQTNVMNLMREYGRTLDNKDKGKNLLHKMLLENRIHLIGLDV